VLARTKLHEPLTDAKIRSGQRMNSWQNRRHGPAKATTLTASITRSPINLDNLSASHHESFTFDIESIGPAEIKKALADSEIITRMLAPVSTSKFYDTCGIHLIKQLSEFCLRVPKQMRPFLCVLIIGTNMPRVSYNGHLILQAHLSAPSASRINLFPTLLFH